MLSRTVSYPWSIVALDAAQYYRNATTMLRLWRQRRRECAEIAAMSELDLKDLGLVPADRRALLQAPFWTCHPFAAEPGPEA
jgi:uncharacterized protein YjiS (DUF1127 family)